MNMIAWIYVRVWMRFWQWRWRQVPDYLPNRFPVEKSLWLPRWLQEAVRVEIQRRDRWHR